jgi:general secretion pathway protein G
LRKASERGVVVIFRLNLKVLEQTKKQKTRRNNLMNKFFKARKSGFTLVELLIVTVIIGILAGMMMLTMGSATDGAEATKIINDLRLVKSAAGLYRADYDAWPDNNSTASITGSVLKSLEKYMDKGLGISYENAIYVTKSDDRYMYGIKSTNLSDGAKKKLGKNGTALNSAGLPFPASESSNVVYMIVR